MTAMENAERRKVSPAGRRQWERYQAEREAIEQRLAAVADRSKQIADELRDVLEDV
jgi:hypothetical protein